MKTVKVSQLKKGDILATSGIEIVTEGVSLSGTPAGKLELTAINQQGKLQIFTWRKDTTVKINA